MTAPTRVVARIVAIVAAAIACSPPAHAVLACTFTITNVNFGNIDLLTGTVFDTTGTFTANCSGGLPSTTARICPNFNAGSGGTTTGNPRFMLDGATQLNYNLFSNSARTTVWGSNLDAFAGAPPTINITLNASGAGSASRTIFARVNASQQTKPVGTFTSSFSGTHTQVAFAQSTAGTCAVIGSTNATSVPFNVIATHPPACVVSATALNFGSAGLLTGTVDASSTLTVACSIAAPYTIGLNGGNAGATDPTQRKMSKAAEQITYGLFRDTARTQPWGNTAGVNTAAGTGNGAQQSFTVFGRVPAQATPSPGLYSDTIVTTVTF